MEFTRLLAWIALLVPVVATAHKPVSLSSPVNRATVLELYTSEGCSSCPPAEHWLSQLRDDPRLWQQLVPVALHVDYWDRLGWRDRFAQPVFSKRQRRYAAGYGLSGVYTPAFVVNGREWTGWFQQQPLPVVRQRRIGRLGLRVTGDQVAIDFHPEVTMPADLQIRIALLGFDIDSRIGAGENAGHTLRHDFVVIGYGSAALSHQGARYRARMTLPSTVGAATPRAIVAWVSAGDDPTPLQALGGWL